MAKQKPDDLYFYIDVEIQIQCSSCNNTDLVNTLDESSACEHFFSEGLRATKSGNCYCPTCSSKKLKS